MVSVNNQDAEGHMQTPTVTAFPDQATGTISYVVADDATGRCAVVDPLLDYDGRGARISTDAADRICAFLADAGLIAEWVLETHVHADHLSAADYLRNKLAARVATGNGVIGLQRRFAALFNLGPEFHPDGSQFDRLLVDGETFNIGSIEVRTLHSPGHTPSCVSFLAGDALFVGDALFMPDFGSGRCDFPGGSATQLYRSVRRLLALPGATRMFVGHDYGVAGRSTAWESTVEEQRSGNLHLREGIAEEDFVAMREARDRTLALPELILPALQVNIRAGALPPAEPNGKTYLKLPLEIG